MFMMMQYKHFLRDMTIGALVGIGVLLTLWILALIGLAVTFTYKPMRKYLKHIMLGISFSLIYILLLTVAFYRDTSAVAGSAIICILISAVIFYIYYRIVVGEAARELSRKETLRKWPTKKEALLEVLRHKYKKVKNIPEFEKYVFYYEMTIPICEYGTSEVEKQDCRRRLNELTAIYERCHREYLKNKHLNKKIKFEIKKLKEYYNSSVNRDQELFSDFITQYNKAMTYCKENKDER